MTRPLCFVLMPFGRKPAASGAIIDFDEVYAQVIRPAIEDAVLEPLRADEETTGGIIHKPMFERLVLCDYAVADLTTANANVFYELGVRHAVRPWSTVALFADSERLPFDVGLLRGLPYALGKSGTPADPAAARAALAELLREARKARTDSPVFQLLDGLEPQRLAHEKTDVFREAVEYSKEKKAELAGARKANDRDAIHAVEQTLGTLDDAEAGVVVDLYLSYRAGKAWEDMVRVAGLMSAPLRNTVMVQEQLAFALNRAGRGDEAEQVLRDVLEKHGASSETYGLLGRVLKDRWEQAAKDGREFESRGHLKAAIEAYRKGFEADWRDAYPGINAVTLMELREPPDPMRNELLPVVEYSVKRRIAAGEPDYWDHATLLELAVLAGNQEAAESALANSLAAMRESWEAETTGRNLRLIREARERRGNAESWLRMIETELENKAKAP